MKTMIQVVATLLLAGFLVAEEPLTNADVIKLVRAGLSTETIVAKIDHSAVRFDTSTDALVALKNERVPEPVIRVMVVRSAASSEKNAEASVEEKGAAEPSPKSAPAVPPVVTGAVAPASPTPAPFKTKRFVEITVHSTRYAGCPGELIVSATGIEAARCRGLDFKLKWPELASVCYADNTKGFMVISTKRAKHRISTTTPIEMKEIRDTVRRAAPQMVETTDCE